MECRGDGGNSPNGVSPERGIAGYKVTKLHGWFSMVYSQSPSDEGVGNFLPVANLEAERATEQRDVGVDLEQKSFWCS